MNEPHQFEYDPKKAGQSYALILLEHILKELRIMNALLLAKDAEQKRNESDNG